MRFTEAMSVTPSAWARPPAICHNCRRSPARLRIHEPSLSHVRRASPGGTCRQYTFAAVRGFQTGRERTLSREGGYPPRWIPDRKRVIPTNPRARPQASPAQWFARDTAWWSTRAGHLPRIRGRRCTLVHRMAVEWDPAKARANLRQTSCSLRRRGDSVGRRECDIRSRRTGGPGTMDYHRYGFRGAYSCSRVHVAR